MKAIPFGIPVVCILFAFLISAPVIEAQTVSSPTVGFVSLDIQPDADTVLTPGFSQAPDFSGKLSGTPTVNGSSAIINIQTQSVGTANQYANSHYLFVRSGGSSGMVLPITGNSVTSLIVDLSDVPSLSMAAEDAISIIPWWTIETLFPAADQPALQKAAGDLPPDRKVEILLYEGGQGTSLSPSRIFYLATAGWRESTRGFPSADDVIIHPRAVMVVRSSAGGSAWKLITKGNVNGNNSAMLLKTRNSGPQDNIVGIDRPVGAMLNELGMESAFVESASNAANDRADELLVMDNAGSAKNRAPSATYFRAGGQWRRDTSGFPESGGDVIPAEAGLIVRKAPTTNGDPVVWVNPPNYP